ncbi:glutamate racemase, partial [Butyricicoccus porcorum]
MDNRAIGVFDSGLGGLTAVRQLHRIMPDEHIIYFGDTGRVPYGTRSRQTIINYTRQDRIFVQPRHQGDCCRLRHGQLGCAGNGQDGKHHPMVGVVKPSCYTAMKLTKSNRVGIIGTKGTI